jgi:drug/metabolite transporter (DMT)-like permease
VSVEHEHLGECLACGYDTAGRSVGDSCPECGAVVVANPFRGSWRSAKVRRRFVRGSRCMVAAMALTGLGAAVALLMMLTPLGRYPMAMTVADWMWVGGLALLAASAVLFAFVWRAIVAVRVLVTLIALLFAAFVGLSVAVTLRLGLNITPEFAGVCLSLLGAAIAALPSLLARSSGRATRFGWLPLVSSAALIAIAVMALTFSSWGRPYEEFATALVLASQFGTAASFSSLQRSIAVGLRDPKGAVHA